METLTDKHNGKSTTYQLVNGGLDMPIAYHLETPQAVINALESARRWKTRIRVYLGDIETGKNWIEDCDIMGYVGLSKGLKAYYPILVFNKRSYGGSSLCDNRILKIKESKGNRVLYQSDKFKAAVIDIVESKESGYSHSLIVDGKLFSNHKSLKSAENLKKKLS